jgi:hypothetical protein
LRIVPRFGAAALLLLSALPATPEPRQKILSTTKTFFIDGQRFHLEKSAGGDTDLIRRQLTRLGCELPDSVPGDRRSPRPIYEDFLRTEGNASPPSVAIPEGLHAEHLLRMESESGPLDLAAGSLNAIQPFVRNRMRERGWKFIESGRFRDPVSLATLKKGRETFLVLLDEKERKFLLVRRME